MVWDFKNTAEKIVFKQKLKDYCHGLLNERLKAAVSAMQQAQNAANENEKSTAGDKHDTARAIDQANSEMFAKQADVLHKEIIELDQINADVELIEATAGACIICDNVFYFVSIGLGIQHVEEDKIVFLSQHSPLFKAMNGMKKGDSFNFNDQKKTIHSIF